VGKFHEFAIVTTLCCGTVGPAIGAAFDDTQAPAAPSTAQAPAAAPLPRPEPPVPPRKYLETGAKLFNKGRYELASKYFEAAELYRDRLTAPEQIVLDTYREKFDSYSQVPKSAEPEKVPVVASGSQDKEVKTASVGGRSAEAAGSIPPASANAPGSAPAGGPSPSDPFTTAVPEAVEKPAGSQLPSTEGLRVGGDSKQKARWLLQLARDQMFRGQFDASEKTIAEARQYQVKWTFFDETPDKLSAAVVKARAKAEKTKASTGSKGGNEPNAGVDPNLPHDKRTARSLLHEARVALNAGQTDRAESLVREVRAWDLRYLPFEDTPDKVSVTVSEARRREASRNADLMVRSYLGSTPRQQLPSRTGIEPEAKTPERESRLPE